MGFVVNTNVPAMIATTQANLNQKGLQNSLERLSSGLKINRAADDASGMAVADSLRSQANSLGQALQNANEAVGIIQVADKAMAEQVALLDTIKTKATQAAQDGQSLESRKAIQTDIKQLMNQIDNIAGTTSYNGKQLLSGNFVNREFQIGAYSRNTVMTSIEATSTDKIGHIRAETTAAHSIAQGTSALTFTGTHIPNGSITMESVEIGYEAGQGIGNLAEVINKNSSTLGVRASYKVEAVASLPVSDGSAINDLVLNGVELGDLANIQTNDADGRLVATINAARDETGVMASIDERGHLKLTSADGRGINIESGIITGTDGTEQTFEDVFGISEGFHGGRLTMVAIGAVDIRVEEQAGGALDAAMNNGAMSEANFNLRGILNGFNAVQSDAMGIFATTNDLDYPGAENMTTDKKILPAGAITLDGAFAVMDIAESAIKHLDLMRSNLGSAQSELEAVIKTVAITRTNIMASESAIRDVDFAEETANFSKMNILVQSGSYAVTQANAVQQNILKLLQ
ncbi:Flagellin FliC [Thiovulum sp. ES]|nr:Flagellin FliC [Thiovulum sp. ES]